MRATFEQKYTERPISTRFSYQTGTRPRVQGKPCRLTAVATYLSEAAQERLWQALSASPLSKGILSGEDLERRRTSERPPQFGDIHLCPVVQTRVEALQHTLIDTSSSQTK